jgi:hypothetical protein
VSYFSRNPRENRVRDALSASSSVLVAAAFLLIGLWSEQTVFFFMAISVLVIGLAEVLSAHHHHSLARTVTWVGRAAMLAAILYILIFLLPGE